MAVVINEFEVIAAPPTPPDLTAKGSDKAEPAPAPPTVHDVVRLMKWYAVRAERVRAH